MINTSHKVTANRLAYCHENFVTKVDVEKMACIAEIVEWFQWNNNHFTAVRSNIFRYLFHIAFSHINFSQHRKMKPRKRNRVKDRKIRDEHHSIISKMKRKNTTINSLKHRETMTQARDDVANDFDGLFWNSNEFESADWSGSKISRDSLKRSETRVTRTLQERTENKTEKIVLG